MGISKKKTAEEGPVGRTDRFDISADKLTELLDQRKMSDLEELGGLDGIVKVLESDKDKGLPRSEINTNFIDRKAQFGVNSIPQRKGESFWKLWFNTFKDLTIIILTVSAIVSLIIGIIEYEEDPLAWIDGVAIIVTICIVATVTAVNDYSKEKQFQKLNAQKNDRVIKVVRDNEIQEISVHEVVVGDLCVVQTGDAIPADGIFISGFNVSVDESAMSGESDYCKKSEKEPFLLSGTNLVEGNLTMIATGVGPRSQWGKILEALADTDDQTPLQAKLDFMAKFIGYIGIGFAVATFLVLFIEFFVNGFADGKKPETEDYFDILDYFIIAVSIIVVAVPEGLPLAVTISLAYSMKRMMKDQNFVRKLEACETMGGCEIICSDKTGTLTLNQMSVVRMVTQQGELAVEKEINENALQIMSKNAANAANSKQGKKENDNNNNNHVQVESPSDSSAPLFNGEKKSGKILDLSPNILAQYVLHAAINSTAQVTFDEMTTKYKVIGNKTEGAILALADFALTKIHNENRQDILTEIRNVVPEASKKEVVDQVSSRTNVVDDGVVTVSSIRANAKKVDEISFSSARKRMTIVVETSGDDDRERKYRAYTKGASEILLPMCTYILAPEGVIPMTEEMKNKILSDIHSMASKCLRTLVLAYRDVSEDEFGAEKSKEANETSIDNESVYTKDLVFHGLVGIKDPLRPTVLDCIRRVNDAGIEVKMVTGDNIETGEAIARECGIVGGDKIDLNIIAEWEDEVDNIESPSGDIISGEEAEENKYSKYIIKNHIIPKPKKISIMLTPNAPAKAIEKLPSYLYSNQDACVCLEGPFFRTLPKDYLLCIAPFIRVLARSSPTDKHTLVTMLKKDLGRVVAVTGDGTNDAPALKAADVGLSMGLSGTEVAKSASDIVILDDRFDSIVKSVEWGRTVLSNIRKFLQFQLTVNVVALITTFVGSVVTSYPPLNTVELLYVNLVMDSLGSLALATEGITPDVLVRMNHPVSRNEFLLTPRMLRNMGGQIAYQIIILMVILFLPESTLGLDHVCEDNNVSAEDCEEYKIVYRCSLLYNVFIWLQLFNEFNCRRIDNELNMFANIIHCPAFIIVWFSCVALHVVLFEFAGVVLDTTTVTGVEWAWAIGIGAVSLILGLLLRFIPCGDRIILKPKAKKGKNGDDSDAENDNGEISELGDEVAPKRLGEKSSSYSERSDSSNSEKRDNEKARLIG